jgi:hypothetical protein
LTLDVYVPLCDSALIACGRGAAGDPTSLDGNLYWGAAYGAERYLTRAPAFRVESRADRPYPDRPHILRELRLVRRPGPGEREVRLRLWAYAGTAIDVALADFLAAAAGARAQTHPLSVSPDLVVWAGHDRLMDVPVPPLERTGAPKPAAVLACVSERFFGPPLAQVGSPPLVLTRSFMAPEAYLLEALAGAVARHGVGARGATRDALVAAYARYQRISPRAAATVFTRLPEKE